MVVNMVLKNTLGKFFGVIIFLMTFASLANAQKVELSDDPQVTEVGGTPYREQSTGRKAAEKFFTNGSQNTQETSSPSITSSADHYMMIGLGAYVNSKSYKWGPKRSDDDPGEFTASVTYRYGEWVNSMDMLFRIEYQTFDVEAEKDPKKLSILPMIIFPDARSGFPLYFGAGVGLGVFMSQPDDESSLSFDYQLVLGGRMLNVFNTVGFFVETGIKNHIHLLSSGQFDGVFVTFGSAFTF